MACGQAEERVLLTGLHAVADIYCQSCKTPLGWKYVSRRRVIGEILLAHWEIREYQARNRWLSMRPPGAVKRTLVKLLVGVQNDKECKLSRA